MSALKSTTSSGLAHDLGLHYAGLTRVHELGAYGVEENAALLRRYEFVHRKLVALQAGHLVQRELWELKVALAKHLYEDAEAANSLRNRIGELRQSSNILSRDPDQRLTLLLEELLHARSDEELLVGLYEVVKPSLLAAEQEHMRATQQIVDQPTIRILRQAVADLENQIAWGRRAIRVLVDERGRRAEVSEFTEKLRGYLAAAGGITGREPSASPLAARRWRSLVPFALPEKAVRDLRMPGTCLYRHGAPDRLPTDDEPRKRLINMMRVRQEEMCAAEVVAAVLWNERDQPWEFVYDLARHCWDEMRHVLMGQAALENEAIDFMNYPQYTSDYDVNSAYMPAAQYVWLTVGIEGGAMRRTGKRAEYEFCRDEARHPLMTQFQDYDWADEVTHVAFGRKWANHLYDGDMEQARAVAADTVAEFWATVRRETEVHAGQNPRFQPQAPELAG